MFKIDWQSMFVPTESVLEVIIRGTIMYVGMFALLRIFRRQAGAIGIADLLVIVVIADAAQNGMAGVAQLMNGTRPSEPPAQVAPSRGPVVADAVEAPQPAARTTLAFRRE